MLGHGASENLCVPFWSRVPVSYCPSALLDVRNAGFQNWMGWGLVFLCQVSLSGQPDVVLKHAIPQGSPLLCDTILFVHHCSRGVGPDYTQILPLIPFSMCLFLSVVSCKDCCALLQFILRYSCSVCTGIPWRYYRFGSTPVE